MSIFGSIMGAIFGHGSAQANASPTLAPGATPASAPPAQTVDVAAIVDKAAAGSAAEFRVAGTAGSEVTLDFALPTYMNQSGFNMQVIFRQTD